MVIPGISASGSTAGVRDAGRQPRRSSEQRWEQIGSYIPIGRISHLLIRKERGIAHHGSAVRRGDDGLITRFKTTPCIEITHIYQIGEIAEFTSQRLHFPCYLLVAAGT